jgi:hypothetical protein
MISFECNIKSECKALIFVVGCCCATFECENNKFWIQKRKW